jgi:Holliday junction resolvase RusA-like endonuclease
MAYRVVVYAAFSDGRVRDLDNVVKAVLDALTPPRNPARRTGVYLWRDDSQVDEIRALRGLRQPHPHLHVIVEMRGPQ